MSGTAIQLAGSRRGIIAAWRLIRFDTEHCGKPNRGMRRKEITADRSNRRRPGEQSRRD